ncbi:hypothetical protein SAMN05660649_04767 [Desulfotomaculum arcticum]|uniref:Uncharacterized protein n=1 Tax=Desulfotruncus arcticus DSM 17038 TaxID=1121424 RepID=A0A1I2Z5V9_9FIRM|nr:hypothetical protein [Desulfotruncus arcticus]SFH33242.1 hypothetical protein SAMN05660649_04767 [Desulfotomaculum arcticum] [Desulfotruncus arcticus DSM 17038]
MNIITPEEFMEYVLRALGRDLTEKEKSFVEHIGGQEWEQRNVIGGIFKEIAEKRKESN